jgi:pantothenate kinase
MKNCHSEMNLYVSIFIENVEFLTSFVVGKDPKNAHFRRGAPWTFDPQSIINCFHKFIKNSQST